MLDATIDRLDSSEFCDLVGWFNLSMLSAIFVKESVGLYRDTPLFHNLKLKTIPSVDHSMVNFLDVVMDLIPTLRMVY